MTAISLATTPLVTVRYLAVIAGMTVRYLAVIAGMAVRYRAVTPRVAAGDLGSRTRTLTTRYLGGHPSGDREISHGHRRVTLRYLTATPGVTLRHRLCPPMKKRPWQATAMEATAPDLSSAAGFARSGLKALVTVRYLAVIARMTVRYLRVTPAVNVGHLAVTPGIAARDLAGGARPITARCLAVAPAVTVRYLAIIAWATANYLAGDNGGRIRRVTMR